MQCIAGKNRCIDHLSEFMVQSRLLNELVQILFHILKYHVDNQLMFISTF